MKRVIYKFPVRSTEPTTPEIIKVSKNAEILSTIFQNNNIMVYILVDLDEVGQVEMSFFYTGTGIYINNDLNYKFIGTVKDEIPPYIWHVFYKKEQVK